MYRLNGGDTLFITEKSMIKYITAWMISVCQPILLYFHFHDGLMNENERGNTLKAKRFDTSPFHFSISTERTQKCPIRPILFVVWKNDSLFFFDSFSLCCVVIKLLVKTGVYPPYRHVADGVHYFSWNMYHGIYNSHTMYK